MLSDTSRASLPISQRYNNRHGHEHKNNNYYYAFIITIEITTITMVPTTLKPSLRHKNALNSSSSEIVTVLMPITVVVVAIER